VRLAIIGLGMAAAPHVAALRKLGDRVEVRWAASPSRERTQAFAAAHPFPVTNDVDAVIADREVDAILLLTPPSTHLDLGARILSAGKHLLVEKPLEVDLGRAAELVAAARRADRRLGVVLQHRFRPGARRLRSLLDSGALGAVQLATMAVPWWRSQAYYDEPGRGTRARDGGGVLLTQAIHTLDLFRSLVGPLELVASLAGTTALHRMETEDHALALFRLGAGGTGAMTATTAAFPGRPESIDIVGTTGSARLEGESLTVLWQDGRREAPPAAPPPPPGAGPMDFSHEAHRALIEDFVAAVADGRDPEASGEEALATQALIECILREAR